MTIFSEKEEQKFTLLYEQANHAGELSANAVELPEVRLVETDVYGNRKAGGQEYTMQGMCGFNCVYFPANTKFSKWMQKEGYARKDSYNGGMRMNISQYGQSYDKKCAYGEAFAKVLSNNGIKKVYSEGRLD